MKVYLFIETGEVRVAKRGEWYTNSRGEVFRVEATVTGGERNVVTHHEIEVPEGAYGLFAQFVSNVPYALCMGETFPIPKPKVKVKKWYWIVNGCGHPSGFYANSCHRTEEQIKQDYPDQNWYHRIDETMVEVEE